MEGNYNNNYNDGYSSGNSGGYGSSQNENYNPYHIHQEYSQSHEQTVNQQTGYQKTGYQQAGYQQTGYQQAGYQQTGNQQAENQQTGYQQTGNQQAEYQQNAYQQRTYQQNMQESPKKKSGFGETLIKAVTIALVFGLVAGGVGSAVMKFADLSFAFLEDVKDQEEREEQKESQKEEEKEELKDSETVKEEEEVKDPLQQTTTGASISAVMDVSDIVENVMPCVVAISNTGQITYQSIWGEIYTQESESAGTGFLVKQDNTYIYIATNNHVVADATKLEVQFCDSTIVEAEIKGTVASKDLAVIKVPIAMIPEETMQQIRIATLGDANELKVGEAAIAIGNALGYGQSVTTGVISAKGRSVTVQDSTTGSYVVNNNLIQTDAAINPGNSGGALLNIDGEVIGINSVKYADTDVEGIGYAIPINDAMLIINKMIEGERIDESQSGYLGIQGQDSSLGAYVHSVLKGSAAEQAGIKAGDIIVGFEGYDIATMSQLKELLSYYPAGEKVEFEILRPTDNEEYSELTITVTLGDASIITQ